MSRPDAKPDGAEAPAPTPSALAELPGYLLGLDPAEACERMVELWRRAHAADPEPPDFRDASRFLLAARAQWRRSQGDDREHAAVAELLAGIHAPSRPSGASRPPTLSERRQRLGSTQRAVLGRAYRLVPEVGDEAMVRPNFKHPDDRKALARLSLWAPGLQWIPGGHDGPAGDRIRRAALCHAEIERLLGCRPNARRA